jgi:hypothetical protein
MPATQSIVSLKAPFAAPAKGGLAHRLLLLHPAAETAVSADQVSTFWLVKRNCDSMELRGYFRARTTDNVALARVIDEADPNAVIPITPYTWAAIEFACGPQAVGEVIAEFAKLIGVPL